ncbi:MAG: hypothetical protein HZA89_13730 [Verrucomicrobia bacterium]|nr:hypothetical protein [Verrucomicrobiota bacterium]
MKPIACLSLLLIFVPLAMSQTASSSNSKPAAGAKSTFNFIPMSLAFESNPNVDLKLKKVLDNPQPPIDLQLDISPDGDAYYICGKFQESARFGTNIIYCSPGPREINETGTLNTGSTVGYLAKYDRKLNLI